MILLVFLSIIWWEHLVFAFCVVEGRIEAVFVFLKKLTGLMLRRW